MSVRTLLVDDHAVVREGYRRLLERTPDIRVVAETSSGEEAYRTFCELAPDVVVMDINLPGTSGVDITRRIVARDAQARVLVFSMHEDAMFASRALEAGAKGYVTKASAPEVLVEAVRAVAGGRVYLSQDVAQQLALQTIPGHQLPLSNLSAREFEVFRLLAEGRSVVEIAQIMCLSQKTIANYQSNIRQKLDLTNAAQIVRLAMIHGLLDKDLQ
ncbi:MAG TPA: response regulator transcription factor [Burkholderiales bacterium]|jgi:DNA-binding NarL/FixJ family response regulator